MATLALDRGKRCCAAPLKTSYRLVRRIGTPGGLVASTMKRHNLRLKKESIRNIDPQALERVVGGRSVNTVGCQKPFNTDKC